ncbi:MAG: PDZ domain-containing protein [Gemmatimonadetes bacterium]|nr:PDZ domain-containing protein [Gemmatimonadota bacterium]
MNRRNVLSLALGTMLAVAAVAPAAAQDRDHPDGRSRDVRVFQAEGPRRAWLGINFDWSSGEGKPITVEAVFPRSPAEKAGVAEGDTLVRLNGQAPTVEAIRKLDLSPGDVVRMRLRRGGRERDVSVTAEQRDGNVIIFQRGGRADSLDLDRMRHALSVRLDTVGANLDSLFVRVDSLTARFRRERPDRAVTMRLDTLLDRSMRQALPFSLEVGSRALAGAEFTQVNPELGRYFGTNEGLLTLRVAPGTPAARAGLEAGDVVVRAGDTRVLTLRDLRRAVADARDRTAKLEVIRQGKRREVTLKWEGGAPIYRALPDGGTLRLQSDMDRARMERALTAARWHWTIQR